MRTTATPKKYRLFGRIDSKATYSSICKEKFKDTYRFFKQGGFEFTKHALNRVLRQKTSKEKTQFTNNKLLEVLNAETNYLQPNGNMIKYRQEITAAQAADTGEIISVVSGEKPRAD